MTSIRQDVEKRASVKRVLKRATRESDALSDTETTRSFVEDIIPQRLS